jgi:transposase
MRPNGSPELLEERRQKAIELLETNLKPVEVARLLGVDRRSVRRWKSAYLKNGKEALKPRPTPGRTPKLTDQLKAKISRMLEKGPAKYGFKEGTWTYSRVAKSIKKEFGVKYHLNYMGPLLRSMGWNLGRLKAVGYRQKPEKRFDRYLKRDGHEMNGARVYPGFASPVDRTEALIAKMSPTKPNL